MDLGGGSTQLTWMIAHDGMVETSKRGSISFPYGAAALTRRLQLAREKGQKAVEELKTEMKASFQSAYPSLVVPDSLEREAKEHGGFDLYLSGGGFRGWGYLLMSKSRLNPYPIPIINGFRATPKDFQDTSTVMKTAADAEDNTKIFRVSKRRASQVPAVALLVNVLTECLPAVKAIRFCQGGVREGFLFDRIDSATRKQDPLLVATMPYETPSATAFYELLKATLPETTSPILSRRVPPSFSYSLLRALSNLLFAHVGVPRETRPAAGLYSTTTGILACANSLAHSDRAILALILCERWPGDLAPAEKLLQSRLQQFVSVDEAWWCVYLGRVATLIGDVYPAGRVPRGKPRIEFGTSWTQVFKKKQGTTDALCLKVVVNEGVQQTVTDTALKDTIADIEKCGKLKNWIQAKDRLHREEQRAGDYGVCVDIELSSTG
jgi:retrograde regulation protein 2